MNDENVVENGTVLGEVIKTCWLLAFCYICSYATALYKMLVVYYILVVTDSFVCICSSD